MQTHERLGHGYILKKSKFVGSWLVDPFVLKISDGVLLLDRTIKRMSLRKDKPYILHGLSVSEIRYLSDAEYVAMRNAPEFTERLADDFSITQARCFEASFSHESKNKSLVIVAPYRENVEKLQRIMKQISENKIEGMCEPTLTADDILAPTNARDRPILVTPMLSYIYDDQDPVHLSTVIEEDH